MKVNKKVDVRNGEVGIEEINEPQVNNFVIDGGKQRGKVVDGTRFSYLKCCKLGGYDGR